MLSIIRKWDIIVYQYKTNAVHILIWPWCMIIELFIYLLIIERDIQIRCLPCFHSFAFYSSSIKKRKQDCRWISIGGFLLTHAIFGKRGKEICKVPWIIKMREKNQFLWYLSYVVLVEIKCFTFLFVLRYKNKN